MTPAKTTKAATRVHTCARCGRTLKAGRWVFSRFTGNRYCIPGDRGACIDAAGGKRRKAKR